MMCRTLHFCCCDVLNPKLVRKGVDLTEIFFKSNGDHDLKNEHQAVVSTTKN